MGEAGGLLGEACYFGLLVVAVAEAGGGHLFSDAAVFGEVFLEAGDVPAYQGVELVDEGDGDVGDGLIGALLDAVHIVGRGAML